MTSILSYSSLEMQEQLSAPETPPTGRRKLFIGDDGGWYTMGSDGIVTPIQSSPTGDSTPTGVVNQYAGLIPPLGWLLCDGAEIDRVVYSDLFNTIGEIYGVGDGTSTFNLPDMRGRSVVGVDGGVGRITTNNGIGDSAGEENHLLTVQELASHTHTLRVTTETANAQTPQGGILAGEAGGATYVYRNIEPNADAHASAISSNGSDVAHNNMQPYLIMNFIIKY